MQTKAAQRWLDRIIIAIMAILGVFMILPFAWLFSMSFRAPGEAYKMPPSFIPPGRFRFRPAKISRPRQHIFHILSRVDVPGPGYHHSHLSRVC